MILTCPSCGKKFRTPDDALGESGRRLRCAACKHVWFAAPEAEATQASESAQTPVTQPQADVPPPCPPEKPEDTGVTVLSQGGEATRRSEEGAARSEPTLGVARPGAFQWEPEKKRRRERGEGWLILLLLIVLIGAAAYGLYRYRVEVMRAAPETIRYYEMAKLVGPAASDHLKYREPGFSVAVNGDESVLVLRGHIVNTGNEFQRLPTLRAIILDNTGRSVLTWTFPALVDVLGPGEEALYRATYPDPPRSEDLENILMTFEDVE